MDEAEQQRRRDDEVLIEGQGSMFGRDQLDEIVDEIQKGTKRNFTPEDDQLMFQLVDEMKAAGHAARDAFPVVADQLGRTPGSISTRYYNLLRKSRDTDPKEIVTNNKNVLVLKLKGLVRDRNRATEKFDAVREERDEWKNKYESLQKKYEAMVKEMDEIVQLIGEEL